MLSYGCAERLFSNTKMVVGRSLFMLNEDVLKEFLFECKIRKLSERTIKGYRNANLKMFQYLENEFQIKELKETNHLAIKSYIEFLTDQKLSETYINRLMVCFKCYFEYCLREGYITINPMNRIKKQKEPIVMIETFSNDEVCKMIKVYKGSRFLDVRNQLIMVMLFDTGMRNSELCNLRVADIRETYIHIFGKGKKTRYVPVTPIINKYLVRYMRVRRQYISDKISYDTEYLLLSQKGKKLTVETLERIVKEAGERVGIRDGIRVSSHTCRHYYAQAQLKNGCDLYTVSKLLGHSKVETTKRYLQSMQDGELMEIAARTSPLMCL